MTRSTKKFITGISIACLVTLIGACVGIILAGVFGALIAAAIGLIILIVLLILYIMDRDDDEEEEEEESPYDKLDDTRIGGVELREPRTMVESKVSQLNGYDQIAAQWVKEKESSEGKSRYETIVKDWPVYVECLSKAGYISSIEIYELSIVQFLLEQNASVKSQEQIFQLELLKTVPKEKIIQAMDQLLNKGIMVIASKNSVEYYRLNLEWNIQEEITKLQQEIHESEQVEESAVAKEPNAVAEEPNAVAEEPNVVAQDPITKAQAPQSEEEEHPTKE